MEKKLAGISYQDAIQGDLVDSEYDMSSFMGLHRLSLRSNQDLKGLNRFTAKNYELNVAAIRACIHDNRWDEECLGDVAFAVIFVSLSIDYKAIPITSDQPFITPDVKPQSLVTQQAIDHWRTLAKPMMMAVLHAVAQGDSKDTQRLLKSLRVEHGLPSSIPKSRLKDLVNCITRTTALEDFCKVVTLGELNVEQEVLKKHLMWFSSPSLIKTALETVESTSIMNYIDHAEAVEAYLSFEKAGLAAQIASGPLKVYCKGQVNPLLPIDTFESVPISDLCPISAPYFPRLLKQAKIILEEYKIPHGRWYQGEKAKKLNIVQSFFRTMVRNTRDEQQRRVPATKRSTDLIRDGIN